MYRFATAILNAILGIFSLDSIPVSSDILEKLAVIAATMEGPLSMSELVACQLGLADPMCPEGTTDEDVTCQLDFLQCTINNDS